MADTIKISVIFSKVALADLKKEAATIGIKVPDLIDGLLMPTERASDVMPRTNGRLPVPWLDRA